jgi:transposase
MPMYVGLDVHKRTCHATVIDEHGEIVEQRRFVNQRDEYEYFFKHIKDAKVAMEACYCYQPVYELLEGMGIEVKLAHPNRTRAIAEEKLKTDAKDSEVLAKLLAMDWLPIAYVPPQEIRDLRDLVRLRTYLVMVRTMFKNKIRAELAKGWIEIGDPWTKKGKRQLGELGIVGIDHCLPVINVLDERIAELSKLIQQRAGESEDAKIIMSIPGIGYFSAMAILAEVGEIERFPNEEKLCSYAGIVPSLDQSGNKRQFGHITKEGNVLLRWVLIECVWSHLQHAKNTRLTQFFRRVARRRGEQVAAVATARKLLVAIYWMLKRREKFRP